MTATELAKQMADSFEVANRPDGSTFIRLRDNSPEWMSDMVREVFHSHAEFLPDDHLYNLADACLSAIAETDDGTDLDDAGRDFADGWTDHAHSALARWVASPGASGYIDDAIDEFGAPEPFDFWKVVQMGQYMQNVEAWDAAVASLTDLASEMDDAEDG